MTTKSRKALAWGIAALSATLIAAFFAVTLTLPSRVDERGDIYFVVPAVTGMLAFAGVGALIASQTRNPIGWIFLAIAALVSATFVAQSYTEYAVPNGAPLASIAHWLANWLLVGALALPVAVFFLYPTGTPASGRWLWVWRVYLVALAVNAAGWVVLPFESKIGGVTVRNPVALEPIGGAIGVVLAVAGFTLVASAFLSFASLIVRFRRAGDEERQQIGWLAVVGVVAAIAFALGLVAGIISDQTHSRALEFFGSVMGVIVVAAVALGIPITAGVAILRYRLYDLDIVVKKTVVFTIIASTLTVLYLAVLALAALGNVSRIVVGVVLLAVTFNPVRRAARTIADRVVYGKRATPYEVLTSFSGRVGETYSANDVLPRMARVLAEGVGAERATVWLRVGGELRPEASWPTDASPRPRPLRGNDLPTIDEGGHAVEVRDQGELLGALSLVMPPSEPMNRAKEALVQDLASQAGLVLRNARLIEELRASRQRIVAAQDARAKQLERNIHDGAQQQLVALTVKLRLLGQLASRDPARTAEMASELQTEATEALEDLRDLARGIYPPLLADKGLGAALQAQARKAAISVSVETDGIGRYPQDVEAALYFCCLEALQNVSKYANTTHATVRLSDEEGLSFEVSDDGSGFDPSSTGYGHRPAGNGRPPRRDRGHTPGAERAGRGNRRHGTRSGGGQMTRRWGSATAATLHALRRCGRQFSLILVLVVSGCVGPRPSETSTTAVEADIALGDRMDAAAAAALREIRTAGFSVAVVRDGQPVLAKGYGYADLAERVPASANTIYRLASITKQFTAAAILHLAEEGKLSLDDQISDYLPDYPASGRRITIRNLLSHTSGLSDVAVVPILEEAGAVGYTRDQVIDMVASQPLDFEPGTGHSYSNVGYMLAGVVIEQVTGTTYADHVTNEVLRPLGLDQTSFCPDEQPPADRWAHGYDLQHGNWPRALRLGRAPAFVDPAPINMEVVSSAGGLCSTVTDLARWPGLLRSFLDPASYREMSEPTVLADGNKVPYGLGLQIREFGSHPALSHGGVVTGFISVVADFPEDDLTVAILVNSRLLNLELGVQLANRVLGALYDEPASQWSDPLEAPVPGT